MNSIVDVVKNGFSKVVTALSNFSNVGVTSKIGTSITTNQKNNTKSVGLKDIVGKMNATKEEKQAISKYQELVKDKWKI
jgi:hypothetical protein